MVINRLDYCNNTSSQLPQGWRIEWRSNSHFTYNRSSLFTAYFAKSTKPLQNHKNRKLKIVPGSFTWFHNKCAKYVNILCVCEDTDIT